MPKPRYKSLPDYMERTGTSAKRLLEIVFEETGVHISPSFFSMILSGSRRCSKFNAFAIHTVTGIPMDELTRWPRYVESETSPASGQGGV